MVVSVGFTFVHDAAHESTIPAASASVHILTVLIIIPPKSIYQSCISFVYHFKDGMSRVICKRFPDLSASRPSFCSMAFITGNAVYTYEFVALGQCNGILYPPFYQNNYSTTASNIFERKLYYLNGAGRRYWDSGV